MPGKHIVIAAGGTGGHFYPALAIAHALKQRNHQVSFAIGGHHAADQIGMADEAGFSASHLPAPRLRLHPLHAPLTALRLWRAYRIAQRLLADFAPDAVLAMGSYACVPAGLAAVSKRIPLALHEGNAVVGRANRLLSRWARALAASLPLVPGQNVRCRTVRTGLPLRSEILEAARSADAAAEKWRADEGVRRERPILLVFGGSQGADFLNRIVPRAVARLPEEVRDFQVVHLTGRADLDAVQSAYAPAGIPVHLKHYETNMGGAYAASDLAVCRAGAATVTELALFARPAVLIPLSTAADDHQTANARQLAALGAGEVLPQSEATPERLAGLLADWRRGPQEWRRRGEAARPLAVPDAADRVAELLEELTGA